MKTNKQGRKEGPREGKQIEDKCIHHPRRTSRWTGQQERNRSSGVPLPFNMWHQPWTTEDRSNDSPRQGNSYD